MDDEERARDAVAAAAAAPPPAWFTPARLLLIFCLTNLMVYLDRGVIASNGVNGSPRTEEQPAGSGIQGEFGLSNLQDGFLATSFLVGLLLASPIFSESCKHYSAFRLIAIGMGTWTAAVVGCGLAPAYGALIACRMLVGVGEASFVALAAPFIDDYAPAAQKARWFAMFYLCIPVGFAAGYMFGGVVGPSLGWRAAFLLEGLVMLPFVVFASLTRPLHLAGSRESGPDPTAPRSLGDVVRELARDAARVASHSVWLHMCGAYVLYTAVLGVYAFWGPKAGKAIYQLEGETADLVFGSVTVATGVVGSLAGGLLLDALGATLSNACLVCGAGQLVGLALVLPAFLWARSFAAFTGLFALGELGLFTLQAPVAAIGMWAVPAALRPLAISMTTVLIHLLGDVPSPPLVGALQSALAAGKAGRDADEAWRASMGIISCLLALSGAVFLRGAAVAVVAPDYRKADEAAAAAAVAETHTLHPARHQHGQGRDECSEQQGRPGAGPGPGAGSGSEPGRPAPGWIADAAPAACSPQRERQPLLDAEQQQHGSSSSSGIAAPAAGGSPRGRGVAR